MNANLEVMNNSTESYTASADQADVQRLLRPRRRFTATYAAGDLPILHELDKEERRRVNTFGYGRPSAPVSCNSLDASYFTQDNWYRVQCFIEVENDTGYALSDPNVSLKGGELSMLPRSILPHQRNVTMSRCSYRIFGGSSGVVSWLIEPLQRRLVVMWSVPFSLVFYRNKLAVGLTPAASKKDYAERNNWFYKMYNGDVDGVLSDFQSKEYGSTIQPIYVENEAARLSIEGSMTDGYKAHVRIAFGSTS
ncbi:tereporin-Ca1-like [Littorina saxatilis]|uniref:Uncharacterized protein n=1 Tax=Littorina saxatilis TaxID=31220 RepID=A0AAN9FXJ9_9CAEN